MKKRLYLISAICALCIGMTGCGESKAPAQSTGSEPESSSAGQSSAAQAESGAESAAKQSSAAETHPATPDIPAHYDELQDGVYVKCWDLLMDTRGSGSEELSVDERLSHDYYEGFQKLYKQTMNFLNISDGCFQHDLHWISRGHCCYSGTVAQNKDELHFNYKDLKLSFYSQQVIARLGESINISADSAYDHESDSRFADIAKYDSEMMRKWNATGSILHGTGVGGPIPNNYLSFRNLDRSIYYKLYPLYLDTYSIIDNYPTEESEIQVKVKNDFLCVDTYGLSLNTTYTHKAAFSLNFNYKKAMEDCKYSRLYRLDGTTDPDLIYTLQSIYGDSGEHYDTTIEFADGKWTWKNSSGNLINNGSYIESEKYPGLIEMDISEQSATYQLCNRSVTYFYIADDGRIYYPYYIKVE